eukprot:9220414-Alexandrium_andersonii.AAC.1
MSARLWAEGARARRGDGSPRVTRGAAGDTSRSAAADLGRRAHGDAQSARRGLQNHGSFKGRLPATRIPPTSPGATATAQAAD